MKKNFSKKLLLMLTVFPILIGLFNTKHINAAENTVIENETFITKSVDSDEIDIYNIPNELKDKIPTTKSDELITPGYVGNNSLIDITGVIGPDDRTLITTTTVYPYSAIAFIESRWPNGDITGGSAWLFAKDAAATAGHNIYNSELGGWVNSVTIWPGRNGNSSPFGSASATSFTLSNNWLNNQNDNYDYAILKLSSSIGEQTGYFGFSTVSNTGLVGKSITITGYPFDSNDTNKQRRLWGMSGTVASYTTYRLSFLLDVTSGQSGCPIYWNDSSYGTVAGGIVTKESSLLNYGVRITQSLYELLLSFR